MSNTTTMTKKQAKHQFLTLQGCDTVALLRASDKPALRQRWNDFVNDLARMEAVTERQASTWVNPFLPAKHR